MRSDLSTGMPIDLNHDSRADAIGYDTTGDGQVRVLGLGLRLGLRLGLGLWLPEPYA